MTSQRTLKIKIAILRSFVLFITVLGLPTVFAGSAIAQNPVPFIDQPLVPDASAPGGPAFTLTVNGAGFVTTSVVNWNGSPLATTFVSSAQLTASVPASDIATASTASVTVVNPSPGGVSNTQFFSITVAEASISFLPAVAYASDGYNTESIAVADVNGDGKPDLIVTSWCTNYEACMGSSQMPGAVGVLLGNGDGTFQPAVSYSSGGGRAVSVAVVDVNGDGKPDLVVANECAYDMDGMCSGTGSVAVLLGNGDGTFQSPVTYPAGTGAYSAAVADLNGDGKLDLIVATCCSNGDGSIGVLLGNGDGTFQPAVLYDSGGASPLSVAITDVNGDGKPDLAVANEGLGTSTSAGSVGVLLGNGDGTFQPVMVFGSGGYDAYSVAVADLNGDGKPDLAVANFCATEPIVSCGNGSVGVLLGNGDGTFQPAVLYGSGGQGAESVAAGDLNGDGKLDLAVENICGLPDCPNYYASVGVLLGNGDGTFQQAMAYYPGGDGGGAAAIADVNGDGKPDLLVALPCFGNGNCVGGVAGVLLNANATTTTLASSLNPSVYGQAVTFTAAVSSASGTPTGTVVFTDASTSTTLGSATLASGRASISVSSLAPGSHSITAAYQGFGTFLPSTSAPLNQVVSLATTTTSVASSANPARVKQRVTYTATVTGQFGGAVTGTVTFQDNGSTIATVTLSGNQAAYSTSYTKDGVHLITATYSGDANNAGSVSPVLIEDIGKPPFLSDTTLATSGSPSQLGQPVTFTATVTSKYGAIPNGELVTFYDGKTEIGTGTTTSGVATFTTSSLTARKHTIKATYAGDAEFKPSTGKVIQVVEE